MKNTKITKDNYKSASNSPYVAVFLKRHLDAGAELIASRHEVIGAFMCSSRYGIIQKLNHG